MAHIITAQHIERVASTYEGGAFSLTDATYRASGAHRAPFGMDYAIRAFIREALCPGEYRNDGARINETADERLSRLGNDGAARELRALAQRMEA
ncbi:hypothetical protein [Sphingobium amiense]|uniref:hypothetical protein n=1 Tax=Sphingobium amiense TaxID=135719 RepID=UPI000831DC8D|nr:hypothetical protein [Sphingobium amiense]